MYKYSTAGRPCHRSSELSLLSREMAQATARMADYGAELEDAGKVLARYHIVGAHGGAWRAQRLAAPTWALVRD